MGNGKVMVIDGDQCRARGWLWNGADGMSQGTLILAHGAGAPMDSEFMQRMAELLAARGVNVLRFEFPYMAQRRSGAGKRPPNPQGQLLDCWRALYGEVPAAAQNLARWLDLGREAALPVAEPGPEVLRRTEQRAIVLQLERLMAYPMVRDRVDAGQLTLHGWHYVIEDGEIHVFDVGVGNFVPASQADNAGTGPYQRFTEADALDYSGVPLADGEG